MDLDLAKSRYLKVSTAFESLLICSGIQSMGGVCRVRAVWVFLRWGNDVDRGLPVWRRQRGEKQKVNNLLDIESIVLLIYSS